MFSSIKEGDTVLIQKSVEIGGKAKRFYASEPVVKVTPKRLQLKNGKVFRKIDGRCVDSKAVMYYWAYLPEHQEDQTVAYKLEVKRVDFIKSIGMKLENCKRLGAGLGHISLDDADWLDFYVKKLHKQIKILTDEKQ